MTIVLRPYQQDGLTAIRAAFALKQKRVLYVLPTGAGKTACFTAIAKGAGDRGKRILILVHRNELLRQCRDKLTDLGVRSGIIKSGYTMELTWHVQVGSVQTVVKRLDELQPPDLIICDEGHHAVSKTYATIFKHWPDAYCLLVTATPARLDGRGLGAVADVMLLGPDMQALIDQGYLAMPTVFAPPPPDLSSVPIKAGELDLHKAAAIMDTPKITGDAVEHYRKLCDKRPALAFCTTLEHAEHVAKQFRESGYNAKLIQGKHTDEERQQMLEDLAAGRIHVLTSVSLIGEGVDVPVVEASILLRPTKSVAVYLQQIGRAMRVYPGKERALVLDHVGAWLEHGLPTAPREWSLDSKKRKKASAPSLRQCPKCWCAHEPMPVCPSCGYVYPVEKRAGIEQVGGSLVEITPEAVAKMHYGANAQAYEDYAYLMSRKAVDDCKTLSDLRGLAKARKYHWKWADHIWNARIAAHHAAQQAALQAQYEAQQADEAQQKPSEPSASTGAQPYD